MKRKLISFALIAAVLSMVAYAAAPTLEAVVSDVIIELNGQKLTLTDANGAEVKPLIVNGTTYLPVRAIGENLGLEVGWDGETRTVKFTSGVAAQNTQPIQSNQPPSSSNKDELTPSNADVAIGDVRIKTLNKRAEYVIIQNYGATDVNLKGWTILSTRGDQKFTFPDYVLTAGGSVKVGDENRGTVDLHWLEDKGVWNNSETDNANLFNAQGELVSTLVN